MEQLAEDVTATNAWELSERRRAEESYRLLFESNPCPMWVFDNETHRFLAVNDVAVASYGYSRAEFLAMAIEDIRPGDDVKRLHLDIADHELNPGLRKAGIWRHKRKDGTELDVEITTHDHRFEGLCGPSRHGTGRDRARAGRAGYVGATRYRDLFENASDLISTADLESGSRT